MLILASSSPRRRELLATLGVPFTIHKPDIDETQHPAEPPFDYVTRLSQAKAAAIAAQLHAPVTVIAADTVVILAADTIGVTPDGDILGKPTDAAEAFAMLQRLRNRAHLVCTAFTLQQGTRHYTERVQTVVYMRDYSDAEIAAYIATGDPFDKAGSYAIQHAGFHPVARIEGSYTNVVGFPLAEIKAALTQFHLLL
jgi:septum formation protein